MNQAIIFTDDLKWSNEHNVVIMMAQCQGLNIPCHITREQLADLSQRAVNTKAEAIAVAEEYRFDLEDYFEEQIEAEAMNEQGLVIYASDKY